jgi:hypothetical protein
MGFEPEAIEIAIEQTEENDPTSIIDWLQLNANIVNDMITNKIIESTLAHESQKLKKMELQEKMAEIQPATYSKLT